MEKSYMILVETNGRIEIMDFDFPKAKEKIGCDWFEHVSTNHKLVTGKRIDMIVDEEGWLKEEPKTNKLIGLCGFYPEVIAGNVILCTTGIDENGERDFIGFTQQESAMLFDMLRFTKTVFLDEIGE